MSDSLPEWEAERCRILHQIATLGDLRPGSICAVVRRCGKPTCHCAKPDDAGHDPQLRLTHRVKGKTVAESFPSPAAGRNAQAEVEEYRRLRQLSTELIAINRKICLHRPVRPEDSRWTAQEKKAAAILQEVTREVNTLLTRVFAERHSTGQLDLEAVEMLVRSAMHQAGASALTGLLRFPVPAQDRRPMPCPCGQQAHYRELRSKPVLTAVGPAGSATSAPDIGDNFRIVDQSDSISSGRYAMVFTPIKHLSFLLSWTTSCANGSSRPE